VVSMMNTTLLAACLASFALIGVAYAAPGRATSPQVASAPTQSASVNRDVVPAPEAILVTSDVVIVAEAPAKKNPPRAKKSYVCGGWEDSQVGGQFKRCEWK